MKSFENHTGLRFKQDKIHVRIHDGQSMSGMDGKPMRLSVRNTSLNEKRNALVHELAHRLLFGNNLYAPANEGPNGDEFRAYLFQGDVLQDVYGEEIHNFWSSKDPSVQPAAHRRLVSSVVSLSAQQRRKKINSFVHSNQ